MITLNFSVDDQLLTRTDENTVAANSHLVHTCEFAFSSEWDNRGKVATFKKRDLVLSVILENDACTIPPEILQSENKIDVFELSVCGADGNSTITSTVVKVPILAGTWDVMSTEITPTMFEQIMQKIDEVEKGEVSPELIAEAVSDYMEAHPLEPIVAEDVAAYFEAHKSEFKGDKGDTGATPNVTATAEVGATVGTPSVSVTKTGTAENPALHFNFQNLKGVKGDKGDKGNTGSKGDTGATGNGIASIEKTATSGLVDTYTITFTNGNTTTFTVSNGLGIKSADINANGHLIITYSDDTTYDAGAMSDIYATAADVDTKINDVWKAQGQLGAKNLLVYPYAYTSGGYNDLIFTAQSDGSLLCNGSSSGYSHMALYSVGWGSLNLSVGKYCITISADNPSDIQNGFIGILFRFSDKSVTPTIVTDYSANTSAAPKAYFDITQEMLDKLENGSMALETRIFSNTNAVCNNVIVRPMLRLASDSDDTWQPYVKSNKQLTKETKELDDTVTDLGERVSSLEACTSIEYEAVALETEPKYIANTSSQGGKWVELNSAHGATVSVSSGEVYRISGTIYWASALYAILDAEGHLITMYPQDVITNPAVFETVLVTIPFNGKELRVSTVSSVNNLAVEKQKRIFRVAPLFNILDSKKWCVCGDSFTAGDFSNYTDANGNTGRNSDAYDENSGHYKTYPWWISNRNNMDIQWLAAGGADFTNIDGASNPFSSNSSYINYTQIANDCDYITLMYGLNESNLTTEQIGTNADSDNTTLWGAYNVVLDAILTANPTVKIGIIISDGWLSQTYHDALIDIAKYWGIPYLDLRNGEQVPMMINGRLDSVSTRAKTLRNNAFKVTEQDSHPNVKGHKYRSTVIENFLRSL